MKFRKLIGLSIFAASAVSIVACANKDNPSDILNDNEIVFRDNDPNPTPTDGYCLITFDGNGGTFKDGTSTAYFQARKGHNWKRIKDKLSIPMEDSDWKTRPAANLQYKFWQTKDNKAIFDEYVFKEDNITLTAKWGEEYKPTAFSTDSWDQVVEASNKGMDELEAKYAGAFEDFTNKTFIIGDLNNAEEVKAKTRYVEIEGLSNPLYDPEAEPKVIPTECSWPVHVIGMNHDLIKDSPKTVAALTFAFTYTPIPSYGWNYLSEEGHQSWENSTLRNTLNSYFYLQLEDELQSGIQTVRKNTNDGTGKDNISTLDEKIFIPSINEVTDPNSVNLEDVSISSLENSRYEYYLEHAETANLIVTNPFVLTGGEPTPTTAWLRSPYTTSGTYGFSVAMTIKPNNDALGASIQPDIVTGAHAVCPCFAIGENPVCAVAVDTKDDLSFESSEYFAKPNKPYTARVKVTDPLGGYCIPNSLQGYVKVTTNEGTKVLVEGTDYTYNNGDGEINIFAEAIPDNATLIAITLRPGMDAFQSDSWDNVIAAAEEGLAALKHHYGDVDTFVGRQKYLTIDGIKYRTRVIDEACDRVSDGYGFATLTFEFIDVIGNPDIYDTTNNENFPDSQLNFRLSSFAQDKMPFDPVEVKKSVNVKTDDKWDLTYYDSKLFPLSMAELDNSSGEVDKSEGNPYTYYGSDDFPGDLHRYLPGTQNTTSAWIRTPNANNVAVPESEKNTIIIDANGSTEFDSVCTDKNYVAPGFCVGHTREMGTITFSGATDSYLVNEVRPEEITDISVGDPYTTPKISALEYEGEIPTITKDYINITSSGTPLDDSEWDLITYGANDYRIKFDTVPSVNLDISINFPSRCFAVSLDPELTVEANIKFVKGVNAPSTSLLYKENGMTGFEPYTYSTDLTLTSGEKIYFKADGANDTFANVTDYTNSPSADDITHFASSTSGGSETHINLSGNLMSLLDGDAPFATAINADSVFTGMFMNNDHIYDTSALSFTATGPEGDNTAKGTYAYMFLGCKTLAKAPTEIAGIYEAEGKENKVSDTYHSMFEGCISDSFVNMPLLNISKAHKSACERMFAGCTYLKYLNNAADGKFGENLLDERCFYQMFYDAGTHYNYYQGETVYGPNVIGSMSTDAADSCCYQMFYSCYALRSTPHIIVKDVWNNAFEGCFFACNLEHIKLTFEHIGEGTQAFKDFARNSENAEVNWCYLEDVYVYEYEPLSQYWLENDFANWLPDVQRETTPVFYATARAIESIVGIGVRRASNVPGFYRLEALS